MTLPVSVEYLIIHCCANNFGLNSSLKSTEGLINIACILKKNYKNLHIFGSCLLPRDDNKSVSRSPLYAVNFAPNPLLPIGYDKQSGHRLVATNGPYLLNS